MQPGQTVLDIVPESDRLVIEGHLAPNQIENVKPGMPAQGLADGLELEGTAAVEPARWPGCPPIASRTSAQARLTSWLASSSTKPVAELEKHVSLHPGMRSEILLLTGQSTLLDRLLDPLLRNINRAFRN